MREWIQRGRERKIKKEQETGAIRTVEHTNQWPYRHLWDAFTVADKSNTPLHSASPKKQQGRMEKASIDIFFLANDERDTFKGFFFPQVVNNI